MPWSKSQADGGWPGGRLESAVSGARTCARAAVLLGMTTGMLGASQVHRQVLGGEAGERAFGRWRSVWADGLLRTFGVQAKVTGARPAPARGARLVIANHRSPLDILLCLQLVGGTVLSRADLSDWPVLGPAARAADTIFVERSDARSGLSAIREIRTRLRSGKTVVLFPEGGTFAGDEVRPFSAGALAAARGVETEVLPIGFAYEPGCEFVEESFKAYMQRMFARPRIRVGIAIGTPHALAQPPRQGVPPLHAEVQALVRRARQAVDSDLDEHPTPEGGTA